MTANYVFSKEKDNWFCCDECEPSFSIIQKGLLQHNVLAISKQSTSFHVVCDASDIGIDCAVMQHDTDGAERVVCYQ